jgi:broad specificity phosphatase PhoE
MRTVYFVTHPDVVRDPSVPVTEWPLSARGIARMESFCRQGFVDRIAAVYSSEERKARDGADVLARRLGLECRLRADLGENDRSATGYLPPAEFEATADLFFAHPDRSIRGWERARDAQARVSSAVRALVRDGRADGDIAIVAHGGVGALLLCQLLGEPISRDRDQPGSGGGNYFAFSDETFRVVHRWRPIDGPNPDPL